MTPFLERYAAGGARIGVDWFAPLSGWFVVEIMGLEDARPGILAFATRAPPLWRNAVAAALSSGVRDAPEGFLLRANGDISEDCTDVQVAESLMGMKPMDILEAVYSEVPPGLPAVLRKIGSSLLSTADAYVRLHALFASQESERQARARVLEKLDARLDDELIQVVQILDLGILSPKTAMAVRTVAEAHKLNLRLPVIRQVCSTATDESLRQSIEDCPVFRANNWVRGRLGRADQLPPLGIPLDYDPSVERIMPSTAARIGREWSNCLAGHSTAMAMGSVAYFAINDLNIIVLVTRTDGGWLVSGLHGKSNLPVAAETVHRAKDKLVSLGAVVLLPAGPPPELEAIKGVFHALDDLEFDFQGMDT